MMNQSRFKIIKSWEGIHKLVKWCKQTKYCSLDFETTGGSFGNKIECPTIIGISFQIGSAYIIPLGHKDSIFKKEFQKILRYLSKELFENPDIIKVAWNLKFEHKWLFRYGCAFKGRIFDGMLAKYMLDETRPNDLKSMVQRFFPDFSNYEDGAHAMANKVGWANVPLELLSEYCGLDCDLTLRLMLFFEKKLIKAGLYTLYRNLIMQASTVLAESEFEGMPVDKKYLDNLTEEFGHKIVANEKILMNHKRLKKFERLNRLKVIKALIKQTQQEIEDIEEEGKPNAQRLINAREQKVSRYIAGEFVTKKERKLVENFNFSSPNQVRELFYYSDFGFKFPILKYTTDKKTKKPTTTPSTDEDTLIKLKDYDKSGLLDQLIRHRELSKLHSTYMVGMQNVLTPDGRIHGDFYLHGTVTGRLCLSGNALLKTSIGDISIKSLCPDKEGIINIYHDCRILTHTGKYQQITKGINKGEEEMYKVELGDGKSVECTLGHIFLTNKGWVPLREILINTNDYKIKTLI